MPLFLAHASLLIAASALAARRLAHPGIERALATALLAWGNIVATSLLLSAVNRLGEPAWFFRTSVLLAIATWLALRRWVEPPPPEAPSVPTADGPDRFWLAAFFGTLVPIAYMGVRLAATYEPNNYDTLAYHLPRAMYYLGQNNLSHFDTGNPRQIYFPLNYNLLQLFGLIYSPPVQVVNFFNLAAWALAGAAIYRWCRLSAIGGNAALFATWSALTATQVLAQGTATTNDLPTGMAVLIALVFVLRWTVSKKGVDAWLAGLAIGLAAGSKLTVVFFAPAAGLLVLAALWSRWRHTRDLQLPSLLRAWIGPGLAALVLAAPFALINLAEKGEWINKTYDFTLNRPFSFACAWQTTRAYLVQLFIEPLHRFTFDLKLTQELNTWGARTFFPHWNEAYAFSPLYLFPPDLNEDHVWFGLAGPLILVSALLCLWRYRRSLSPHLWCAALGLGWLATYFLLNKWSLYNQRYFVPSVLVMSPCLAVVAEAGLRRPAWQRAMRHLVAVLGVVALWLAGIYLFANTSRPYAPLWAGQNPPPALPALPPQMVARLAAEPRVNVLSTDGNERIFLLMTHGQQQRFTSFARPVPGAYNVFSEWGFVRKVAYSNIEQLSTYTIVPLAEKATAGVEFLGTIGQGQPALDYYGLAPHPDRLPSAAGNRNVLVTLSYAPREPNRYSQMRINVAGLNAPDRARLRVGVEYPDGTTQELATFTATGEAPAPVTRPFRKFTVKVTRQEDGRELGAIDIPYLFRDAPPEEEASLDPTTLFSEELISATPGARIKADGLGNPEGPYPQWDLPMIRWTRTSNLRLEIPPSSNLGRLELSFSLRLQGRETGSVDVLFNGTLVKNIQVFGRTTWMNEKLELTPRDGANVIEFRNVGVTNDPDWLDYLERYPDVKAYVVSTKVPLEQGARDHYEMFGRKETRTLNMKRRTEALPGPDPLYYVFRSLRVNGYPKP